MLAERVCQIKRRPGRRLKPGAFRIQSVELSRVVAMGFASRGRGADASCEGFERISLRTWDASTDGVGASETARVVCRVM